MGAIDGCTYPVHRHIGIYIYMLESMSVLVASGFRSTYKGFIRRVKTPHVLAASKRSRCSYSMKKRALIFLYTHTNFMICRVNISHCLKLACNLFVPPYIWSQIIVSFLVLITYKWIFVI